MVYNPAVTAIQTCFSEKRGFANGIAMMGTSVAIFMWPPVTQLLVDQYGWRGAMLLISGSILHGLPIALMYPNIGKIKRPQNRPNSDDHGQNNDVKPSIKLRGWCSDSSAFTIWKNFGFILHIVCCFGLTCSDYTIFTFIPARALSIGIDKYRAAFLISIYGITNSIGRVFVSLIVDKIGVSCVSLYIIFTISFGIVTIFTPFFTEYTSLAAAIVIGSFCVGNYKHTTNIKGAFRLKVNSNWTRQLQIDGVSIV